MIIESKFTIGNALTILIILISFITAIIRIDFTLGRLTKQTEITSMNVELIKKASIVRDKDIESINRNLSYIEGRLKINIDGDPIKQ